MWWARIVGGCWLAGTGGLVDAYPDAAPLAHSGGHGEPTCMACHESYPLNHDAVAFDIAGLPTSFEAGAIYTLAIRLPDIRAANAGFQLTARFCSGHQAGTLTPLDGHSVVKSAAAIQYATHTLAGTAPLIQDRYQWSLRWQAPTTVANTVSFHLAIVAGNKDASAFEDRVYTRRWLVSSSGAASSLACEQSLSREAADRFVQ